MLKIDDNQYNIGGFSTNNLISDFGSPLYVYDGDVIENQVSKLKNAFIGLPLRLKYACKSLTNLSILSLMRKFGVEIDTVSLEEVFLAKKSGFNNSQILFTPNSISFETLEIAIKENILINVDNLDILRQLGKKYNSTVAVCIRINPHIEAGGNDKIKTGHAESKFGISVDYLSQIVDVVNLYNINVVGLHIHTGSDFSDPEVFMKGAEILFDAAKLFKPIQFFDLGSGFKVSYKKGDKVTDVDYLGELLKVRYNKFVIEMGYKPEIWFEPGKFLVSECGTLLTTCAVLKDTPVCTFVGVDSGLNHLIRPMMYDAYHDIINTTNIDGVIKKYNIAGYICETDNFGLDRELTEVRVGDIIGLKNAGAYGFSMSSNYNSKPRPAEVLVYGQKAQLIRRRETIEDILSTQILVNI